MATQTSLVASRSGSDNGQNRSGIVRTVPKGWMLKPGVPKIILQKPTIITVSGVSGRYAWIRCRTQKPLLLWNCPHLHQIQRKEILQKNPVHAFQQELCQ